MAITTRDAVLLSDFLLDSSNPGLIASMQTSPHPFNRSRASTHSLEVGPGHLPRSIMAGARAENKGKVVGNFAGVSSQPGTGQGMVLSADGADFRRWAERTGEDGLSHTKARRSQGRALRKGSPEETKKGERGTPCVLFFQCFRQTRRAPDLRGFVASCENQVFLRPGFASRLRASNRVNVARYTCGRPGGTCPLVTTLSFLRRQESRHRRRKDWARYVSTCALRMSAGPLPPQG
jgi:hypothetical protein